MKLKLLVAAVALAASASASADVDLPNSGNSSLFLSVFDRAANVGMMVDLGKNYSDFNIMSAAEIPASFAAPSFADSGADAAGVNYSWDLTTGDYATGWNTFLSLVNPANLKWAVTAVDGLDASRGIISTLNQATVTPIVANPVIQQAGILGNYIAEIASPRGTIYSNMADVTNGVGVGNKGMAYIGQYFGSEKNNAAGSVATGLINTSLRIYQTVTPAASGFAATSSQIFGNDARFTLTSAGQLTYATAPVPEADTWAMMMLGLGFMGFIARRKQA